MIRHRAWPIAVGLIAASTVAACTGRARLEPAAHSVAPTSTSSGSPCDVKTRLLPTWARGGFSSPTPTMPYVLGTNGDIVAILFGQPLQSPPAPDRNNKILWVSRVPLQYAGNDALKIQARLNGSDLAATRSVDGGPGPSIIDLPAAGCWSLTLSWGGHQDRMSIPYYPS
jgi:hypothetical protein